MVRASDNFIVDGVISPYSLEIGVFFFFFLLFTFMGYSKRQNNVYKNIYCLIKFLDKIII